jgi:hypothetical protein
MDAHLGLRVSLATLALLAWASPALAAPPVADFAVSPDPPNQGSPATYEVILQGAGVDSTVEWDFDGDGVYEKSGPSVQHTHEAAGDTDVTMRATDEGESTVVPKTLTVNAKPLVTFGFSPRIPQPGQPTLFAADATDPEGDPLTAYSWDFGDGSTAAGSGPTHAFSTPGIRTVTLTVTDSDGAVGTAAVAIEVREPGGAPLLAVTPDPKPSFLTPFPVVRLAGQVLPRVTLVRVLSVRGPRDAFARVRCRGRDCPATSVRKRIRKTGPVRFHVFERSLRVGTRLAVFVRRGDEIGKYTRFVVRAGKGPLRTDRCLLPGRRGPVRCPS